MNNAAYIQHVALSGNPIAAAAAIQAQLNQQYSPRSGVKIRGRSERIQSKVIKYN